MILMKSVWDPLTCSVQSRGNSKEEQCLTFSFSLSCPWPQNRLGICPSCLLMRPECLGAPIALCFRVHYGERVDYLLVLAFSPVACDDTGLGILILRSFWTNLLIGGSGEQVIARRVFLLWVWRSTTSAASWKYPGGNSSYLCVFPDAGETG